MTLYLEVTKYNEMSNDLTLQSFCSSEKFIGDKNWNLNIFFHYSIIYQSFCQHKITRKSFYVITKTRKMPIASSWIR